MLVCPKTGRPTRVKFEKLSDGTKVRVSLASGETVG
jgi:ribosomal protein L24